MKVSLPSMKPISTPKIQLPDAAVDGSSTDSGAPSNDVPPLSLATAATPTNLYVSRVPVDLSTAYARATTLSALAP